MSRLSQQATPLAEALNAQRINRLAHFDVPGHKGGRMNPELPDYFGKLCMSLDVNSMKSLDNLGHPVSVIKAAQELAAEAFGADNAFFMVNGTTSAVQTMIWATCGRGEKIILPRNVHRSAINALVVNGAVPVYINPGRDRRLGIPLGMSVADVKKAIAQHPGAKAILVNNPTYYGICSNLVEIVRLAHAAGMLVLADEAHLEEAGRLAARGAQVYAVPRSLLGSVCDTRTPQGICASFALPRPLPLDAAPDRIVASPVHVGSGHVRCAHGILPVPTPATAYILRDVPMYGGRIRGELCTPTGAALLKHFVTRFGDMPVMKAKAQTATRETEPFKTRCHRNLPIKKNSSPAIQATMPTCKPETQSRWAMPACRKWRSTRSSRSSRQPNSRAAAMPLWRGEREVACSLASNACCTCLDHAFSPP